MDRPDGAACSQENSSTKSLKWADLSLSADVLQRFLLVGLMMMCVNIRPDYKMHWSSDPFTWSTTSSSQSSSQETNSTQLSLSLSISSILIHKSSAQMANLNFRTHWQPLDHVTIDEGLICFKGRGYQHRVHILRQT
jgi:hypothetical protein